MSPGGGPFHEKAGFVKAAVAARRSLDLLCQTFLPRFHPHSVEPSLARCMLRFI